MNTSMLISNPKESSLWVHLSLQSPHVHRNLSTPHHLLLSPSQTSFSLGDYSPVKIWESAIIVPHTLPAPLCWFFSTRDPKFHAWLNAKRVAVIMSGDLNTESKFDDCRVAGVNAICTDHPSLLQTYLLTHKLVPLMKSDLDPTRKWTCWARDWQTGQAGLRGDCNANLWWPDKTLPDLDEVMSA